MKLRDYFEEENLVESFEIRDDYKKLSKNEIIHYMSKIYKVNVGEVINVFHLYPYIKGYIFKNQGREYFIFSFIEQSILEIHFYDVDDGSSYKNINQTKISIPIFSVILSIVLKEIEDRKNRVVKIVAPNSRKELYLKIIAKVLNKYNIKRNIITKNIIEREGELDINKIEYYLISE